MALKAAIFDLDGTLLDSGHLWHQIDIAFLGKRGFAVPDDYFSAIAPMGFGGAAEYTIDRFHLNETPEEVMAQWRKMSEEAFATSINMKPGVREYLTHLHTLGIPCVIATASHRKLYAPALKRNGIDGFFSDVTTITEVKRGKGFPDIYLRAAKKLGYTAAECAVFEDILPGITGAKAGGFFTVAVEDFASERDRSTLQTLSDRYVSRLDELIVDDIFV